MFAGCVEMARDSALMLPAELEEIRAGWREFVRLIGRWEYITNNMGEQIMTKYNAKQVYLAANGALLRPDENMPKNAILFDSKLEGEYYRDELLPRLETAEIFVDIQPQFEILSGSVDERYKFQPVHYTPDFLIIHPDGTQEAIDVKGMPPTQDFVLRRKMFHHRYPLIRLTVLKYVKKYGGWLTLEQYAKAKRANRKMEKAKL